MHLLASSGIPIDRISGVQGNLVVAYMPQATPQQIAAGDAMIVAFDWSPVTHAAWVAARSRDECLPLVVDSQDAVAKLVRGVVKALLDEINILRGESVGVASFAFDPASMANGAGTTSVGINVPGALFGDVVAVAAPYTLAGIVATGYVSAANTVVIRLHNGTGGAVNLAAGNWTVSVRRPSSMPPRTIAQAKNAIAAAIMDGSAD